MQRRRVDFAHVFGFDSCAGTVIDGGGEVLGAFAGDLEGASVAVDFAAIFYAWPGGSPDDPLGTLAVSVEATLTGVGEVEVKEFHSTSGDCPDCSTYDEESQFRQATATIAFSMDGEPLPVTPSPGNLRTLQFRNVEHVPD